MSGRDEESYVAFVSARQDHLRRVAYAICGDWNIADDVLQDALLKLYLAWPRVRRDGAVESYVRQIIVRTDIDRRRRPWRRERYGGVPETAQHDSTDQVVAQDEVFAALRRLPIMQRKVVVLRHWLDLSVEQTAHELNISEGTVKSHSARAMASLRAIIGDPVTKG